MAIFKCVGYFIFIRLKDSASLLTNTRKEQTTKKEQTDKHTRKETTKIKKENSTGTKHK
jgi:hypothetical protein